MPTPTRLVDLSLTDFTLRLAERSPTPGGGSFAAYAVASGAALAAMAARFTSGEKFAAIEAAMARRTEALEPLRVRALALVDDDTQSYDAVTAAYKLPKASDADKAARKAAIQAALRGALEVPFETMQVATAALRLADDGAALINPNLASDCASGALALHAGLESAWNNVKINASSIDDEAFVAARLAAGERLLAEARGLADRIQVATAKLMGS